MSERISFEKEPMKWTSLHHAAEGNMLTAVKQLKRIGYSVNEITDLLTTILKREE